MPPKGHSSSSHSSSSRSSSSHSSSSHHSSGSSFRSSSGSSYRSSSGSSGSSYRSSSGSFSNSVNHYNSTHNRSSSSFHTSGSHRDAAGNIHNSLTRPRYNQPTGYVHPKGSSAPSPKSYHCVNHDYIYYAMPWTDVSTGRYYEKGYYDETGTRHETVVFKNTSKKEIRFVCAYCGTEVKADWENGVKPSCPNCGAPLEEAQSQVDEVIENSYSYTPTGTQKRSGGRGKIIGFAAVGLTAVALAAGSLAALDDSSTDDGYYSDYEDDEDGEWDVDIPDTLYIEEIGRECTWSDEYESFYDADTDCYFWYNLDIDYPCWQYWYEDISSDYGDYGWMEYDEEEQQWYIEADENEWIVLPEEYESDRLWHIEEFSYEDLEDLEDEDLELIEDEDSED